MNGNANIRWAVLFGFTILLPASVLTVMSVRTLVSDDRNALVDLQLRVPALQAHFDEIIDGAVESARDDLSKSHPAILFGFRLDEDGRIVEPRYEPFSIRSREESFASRVSEGWVLEFDDERPLEAVHVYESLLNDLQLPFLRAEVLNLVGRAALGAKKIEIVRAVHDSLSAYPFTFDADGSHPLSISTLRLAGAVNRSESGRLIHGWLDDLEKGGIPLFAGVTQYLKAANRVAQRVSVVGTARKEISRKIDEIRSNVLLIESFDRFKTAGTGLAGSSFLSGVVRDGSSGLIYTHPDGWGVAFDLETVVAELEERLPAHYAVRLFDLTSLPEIERKTSEFVRVVSPASERLHRLNMALFPKDQIGLFRELRQKRVLAVGGVLALAAIIGGGVWLIYRGTTRELEVARLRSEFVSNVSHELRTPLQSIQMYAETLSLGRYRDEAQHQRYLDTITQESNRLSRLVGNVLEFSRIEQGRNSYRLLPTELGPLVSKTVSEFEPGMKERGFTLRKDIEDNIVVDADADALDSVVGNLIANAMKYSNDRLDVEVHVDRDGGDAVIDVLDRGVGVPAGERADVFGKFYRATNVTDATGTGLGLSLVQDIVKAHGGSCEVMGREGGGSVFRVRLPEVLA